jgi:hypothetical protein
LVRIDCRARCKQNSGRLGSARVQRSDHVAQPVDIGAAIRTVVAAIRGGRVDHDVERAADATDRNFERMHIGEIGLNGRHAVGQPSGLALQSEHLVARVAQLRSQRRTDVAAAGDQTARGFSRRRGPR